MVERSLESRRRENRTSGLTRGRCCGPVLTWTVVVAGDEALVVRGFLISALLYHSNGCLW